MSEEKVDIDKKLINPFPGLRPFDINESHLFFGRDGQSDEVLDKLADHRFVGVIGPSGSGKSSFVYCGVLPILLGGFLAKTGPDWEIVVARPGGSPIENLSEAVLGTSEKYQNSDPEDKILQKTITNTLLRSSSLGLVEAILQTKRTSNKNYLVLIDQFEELFRFQNNIENENSVNETLAFVNLLTEAINYADAPIYVAITMRSDFIGDCAQFADLTRKINDSHYLIPQLTRDQKRAAIEGPVAVGNANIAPRLTQQLLNDLGEKTDQLPILQHALMRTFSYWMRFSDDQEPIDLKHYEAIGKMEGALSMHADEAFDELTEKQRSICETLFRTITEKRGENFGIRRPTRLGDIASIANVKVGEVITVIDKFREEGRSLLTPQFGIDIHEDSIVDISHESLMRIWVRLNNWVNDEAEAVSMYLRLSEAGEMYQSGQAALWRPPDLQLALNWKVKHKPTLEWGQRYDPAYERTMSFLDYSKKEYDSEQKIKELQAKRALQRAKITAMVTGSAAVISLIFLLYAFSQKTVAELRQAEAIVARDSADIASKEAIKQRHAADSNALIAKENERKADSSSVVARDQTELAFNMLDSAERATVRAEAGEREAQRQQTIALLEKDTAVRATERANTEAERAKREQFLNLASALSLKAIGNIPDNNLKGLIAQQSYEFNDFYDGEPFNSDIYNGLHAALAQFQDESTFFLGEVGPAQFRHQKEVSAVDAVPGSNFFVTADTEGKILKWAFTNGQLVPSLIANENDGVHNILAIAVSPDGKWLASGGHFPKDASGKTYIELFDLSRPGSPPKKINGYAEWVASLAFTPDSKSIISLDNNKRTIRKFSVGGSLPSTLVAFEIKINHIVVSDDGQNIIGAGSNGNVIVWNKTGGDERIFHSGTNKNYTAIDISPDGNWLTIGEEYGEIIVYNFRTGVEERLFSSQTSKISQIEFSHDSQMFASASQDNSIRLYQMRDLSLTPFRMEYDNGKYVMSLKFTSDDQSIIGGTSKSGDVRLWPTNTAFMADKMCGNITRNMDNDEWKALVGSEIPYEETCEIPLSNEPPNE